MYMRFRITFLRALVLFLAAAIVTFTATASLAEEPHEYSEQEMTGFAFYKLAHKQPHFDDWIDTGAVQAGAAAPADRAALKARLQQGLDSFVPGQDAVTLTSIGGVKLPVIQAKEAKNFQHEKPVELSLGPSPAMTYFPVQVGRIWIAVVLNEEDAFKTLMLNGGEYTRLQSALKISGGGQATTVGIKVTVRPIRIDTHATIALDHKSMWLMMGQVQNLEIWDQQFRHLAWSYNAQGYESGETHDLMNLYSGK
jgi:hypothetical protein